MSANEYANIHFLANMMAKNLNPLKIYLFGSFADNRETITSDYDFYIIIPDTDHRNLIDLITEAQRCIRHKKNRPVDILINRVSDFERLKFINQTVEKDVAERGILIYGQ